MSSYESSDNDKARLEAALTGKRGFDATLRGEANHSSGGSWMRVHSPTHLTGRPGADPLQVPRPGHLSDQA